MLPCVECTAVGAECTSSLRRVRVRMVGSGSGLGLRCRWAWVEVEARVGDWG